MAGLSLFLALILPVINVIVVVDPTFDPIVRSGLQVSAIVPNQQVQVVIECTNATPNPDYTAINFSDIQVGISLYSVSQPTKRYTVVSGSPGVLSNNGNGLYYITDGVFANGDVVQFVAELVPPLGIQPAEQLKLEAWCRSTDQPQLLFGEDQTITVGGGAITSTSTSSSSSAASTSVSTSSATSTTTSVGVSSTSSRGITEEVLPGVAEEDQEILPAAFRLPGNVTTKLKGVSAFELANLQGFALDVPEVGGIRFNAPVDLNNLYDNGRLRELDRYVRIGRGFVEIDSFAVPELNLPALIIMRNLRLDPSLEIVILKDDKVANPGEVWNVAYNPDTDVLSFNVAQFSRYEVDLRGHGAWAGASGDLLSVVVFVFVTIGTLGMAYLVYTKRSKPHKNYRIRF